MLVYFLSVNYKTGTTDDDCSHPRTASHCRCEARYGRRTQQPSHDRARHSKSTMRSQGVLGTLWHTRATCMCIHALERSRGADQIRVAAAWRDPGILPDAQDDGSQGRNIFSVVGYSSFTPRNPCCLDIGSLIEHPCRRGELGGGAQQSLDALLALLLFSAIEGELLLSLAGVAPQLHCFR